MWNTAVILFAVVVAYYIYDYSRIYDESRGYILPSGNRYPEYTYSVPLSERLPHCRQLVNDIFRMISNIHVWFLSWFGYYPDPRTGVVYYYPPKRMMHDVYYGPLAWDWFAFVITVSSLIAMFSSVLMIGRMIPMNRVRCLLCAVTPPFLAGFLNIDNRVARPPPAIVGMPPEIGVRPTQDVMTEACISHAHNIEDMAKTIEFLCAVNNEREKENLKLQMEVDYNKECISRMYKNNRRLQNQRMMGDNTSNPPGAGVRDSSVSSV